MVARRNSRGLLCSAGGSGAPAELLAPLGLDLGNPSVWDDGFAELERMIDEAQTT